MASRIFIDTLFVIALINRRDQYHQQAAELADKFAGHPLLPTDAILLEVGNALARGYKREASAAIQSFFDSSEVDVIRLTPELFDAGFALYATHLDKEWSLVDCISFVVMRREGISQALTFDRHFEQAGFRALMRMGPFT